jgi:uncharacterized iron-regulated membrane protein
MLTCADRSRGQSLRPTQWTLRQRIARRPQSLWARRALFQIHLWTGLLVGVYVVAVSISGSAVVFRREMNGALGGGPRFVTMGPVRLTDEKLAAVAERAHPGYRTSKIWKSRRPNVALDVWMVRDGAKLQHLFDPFTGRDLGPTVPVGLKMLDWMVDFHDNLLGGDTGRFVNGLGGICLLALCLTGMVIWWPGVGTWRRNVLVRWSVGWRRFNWDLHNAVGFWTALLLLMWAISSIYLVFPHPFSALVDYITPPDGDALTPRAGDVALEWLAKLHFGRFAGWRVKALWTALGLIPPVLFVTGAVMWWNRVIRRAPEQALVDNRTL